MLAKTKNKREHIRSGQHGWEQQKQKKKKRREQNDMWKWEEKEAYKQEKDNT